MPRPNHPTDAEYNNALDSAAHYRLKCLKLEEERDTLLAACEELHSFAVGCAHHIRGRASRQRAQAMFDRAREAINKTKGGE